MANTYFYSSEVTAKAASSGEKYNNLAGVKAAEFNYTTAGTEIATDGIELVELPVGSEIIGYVITDAGSGCSDADLGTTFGGAELGTGLAITAATVTGLVAPTALGATNKVFLNIDVITAVASKLISGVILYK